MKNNITWIYSSKLQNIGVQYHENAEPMFANLSDLVETSAIGDDDANANHPWKVLQIDLFSKLRKICDFFD